MQLWCSDWQLCCASRWRACKRQCMQHTYGMQERRLACSRMMLAPFAAALRTIFSAFACTSPVSIVASSGAPHQGEAASRCRTLSSYSLWLPQETSTITQVDRN